MNKLFLLVVLACAFVNAFSQNKACEINEKTLLFKGSASQQAKCLLRPVKPRGILNDSPVNLPTPLIEIIGAKVRIKKENLRRFLAAQNISEAAVGGSLDEELSIAQLPDGETIQADYFLIHDTSTPNYLNGDFPSSIDETTWRGNDLSVWKNQPSAHIFVNRLGDSICVVKFTDVLPDKKFGTKFARDVLKEKAKGLQIHVELVQPRRSDDEWFAGNDAIAPDVGFTDAQYQRLALLYICASVRRGTWLIPAFHADVDAGIKDAHDDPQNFDLEKFVFELKNLVSKIGKRN